MRLKNKNILIILVIGIVLIVSMFFASNSKKEYKELPKVKLKEPLQNKQFALMLEQEDGKYLESEGELPTEGYVFNENKSGCTDINGKIIDGALDYDYETYTVLLDTSKTSYCYLYYDIEPNISNLRKKDPGNYLSKDLQGGMYRYQGIYTDDVRNYICLGDNCCNTTECDADSNDDMYRIIGINAKGELKVIKKTSLTERMQWHNIVTNINWPDSDLFHRLNDNEEGSVYKDNSFYSLLNQNLKNLIIKKDWIYGDIDVGYESQDLYVGNNIYAIESGKKETTHMIKDETETFKQVTYFWQDKISVPISILYIHDYIYAYPNGNPLNKDSAKTSWIFLSNNQINAVEEWLITRFGDAEILNHHISARDIGKTGYVSYGNITNFLAVRPVFYITSDIDLSGEGTLTNPFRIF